MLENIPMEMKGYEQWVCWRYEESDTGKPTKVPYSALTSQHANVNDPLTWCHFESACRALHSGWWNGIGFVLTENDPYGFIDLDQPKSPNGEILPQNEFDIAHNRQQKIYEVFDSYAELSPSGNGLHIIVKGNLKNGRKRSSVEIYSSQRFMTMTGNVFRNAPINDHSTQLNSLWEEMGKGRDASLFYAGLENISVTEEQIMQMAATASNGEKFRDLYFDGNWQKYYPSQSEADFALIDIIAFYSKNRMQTSAIFLKSKLAEREKSRASYRINYMLNRCFDNLLPPVDFEGLRNQVNAAIELRAREEMQKEEIQRTITHTAALKLDENKEYLNLELPLELPEDSGIYSVPPGLVGQIAQFVYSQAPLPVPEIALVAAIGLMSGIIGKAYNISNTGLNQYTLLLSPTGSGKEAISSGISKIMKQVKKLVPPAGDFRGPAEIASPQALAKCLSETPSIFSILGEFGLLMKQIASENTNPNMAGLRRMLLDLFNKSGESDELERTIYSDKAKNTSKVNAPAFSIVGESTPGRFYESLSEEMISEGFLPRFNIIENFSPPAKFNEGAALATPSDELVKSVATLCANSLNLISQNKVIHVQESDEARIILKEFREYAYSQVIATQLDVKRMLWNRAHVKALKLSSTVAVGINPFQPTIDAASAKWAIEIVKHGINVLSKRFERGEIGLDNEENKQLVVTIEKIKDYLTLPWEKIKKLAGPINENLYHNRIIPYAYIQHATASMSTFKKDKNGASFALKRCLKILIERGDLEEISRADLSKIEPKLRCICYAIGVPKTFGI